MRVGYACVNTQLPSPARTTRLANATPERLRELTAANLDALGAILRWNEEQGIQVFRLTSNLVPFASHAANDLPWWDEFDVRLAAIGRLMKQMKARVSTHPAQYIVLSSERADVVAAAVAELEYHARLLRAFGLDASHKIVLHLSGRPGGRDGRALQGRIRAPLGRRA
jgi:UV DNA damage endonuclease